jgi:DHA1 family tetracycline resistance protein-like MFS transporter
MVNPLIAIAYGITGPNMTAMVSAQATPEQQGEVLGINQSMSSLGQIIPPIIGGFLAGISPSYPMIASSVILISAGLVFNLFYRKA